MKTKAVRAVAWAAVIIILLGFVAGMLQMVVFGAVSVSSASITSLYVASSSRTPKSLGATQSYDINFTYTQSLAGFSDPDIAALDSIVTSNILFSLPNDTMYNPAFRKDGSNTVLRLSIASVDKVHKTVRINGAIENVVCRSASNRYLVIELDQDLTTNVGAAPKIPAAIISIDAVSYLESYNSTGSSSGGTASTTDIYASKIIVENVIVTDTDGNRIERIAKNSPAFNIEIVFIDNGLIDLPTDIFDDGSMNVYATDFSGFISSRGQRGTLQAITRSSDGAPRFRARFTGLTWDGSANSIAFVPMYDIYGEIVEGAATTAKVYQARIDADDDAAAPATPYIIVSQYSFGNSQIQAGASFTLHVTCRNTSRNIALDNIVMTVTAPEGLSISSGSNTVFIETLAAGETLSQSIQMEARPNATVGSHSVQIDFSYQYLSKKDRLENKMSESIAIPVSQIDRFTVDPITGIDDMAQVDREFYIEVPFVNKGRSAVYNITASVTGNLNISASSQYYDGLLDAGKSDTLELAVIAKEAGDLVGEIIVQYEDENTNQKEIRVPFGIYIEEPHSYEEEPAYPDGIDPNMGAEESGVSAGTVVLCLFGGLLIAAPIALYISKRIQAKGNEEFDEDF